MLSHRLSTLDTYYVPKDGSLQSYKVSTRRKFQFAARSKTVIGVNHNRLCRELWHTCFIMNVVPCRYTKHTQWCFHTLVQCNT